MPELDPQQADLVLHFKDIPILLGAILSKSQALITLDKKHFLGNQKLQKNRITFQDIKSRRVFKRIFLITKKSPGWKKKLDCKKIYEKRKI